MMSMAKDRRAAVDAQQGHYVQVGFSPSTHQRFKGMSYDEVWGGIREGADWVERELGVRIQFVAEFPRSRHLGEGVVETTLEWAIAHRDEGVVALGLGGYEMGNPPELFAEVFRQAKAHGLRVWPHAGELAGPESGIQTSMAVLTAAVTGILQHPERGTLLVATLSGRPVGVAYLAFTWMLEHGGKAGWLEELYVGPEYRGQGIGRELRVAVCTHAAEQGAAAVDLEVDGAHARAAHLYAREGFRPLDRSRWVRVLRWAMARGGSRTARMPSPYTNASNVATSTASRSRPRTTAAGVVAAIADQAGNGQNPHDPTNHHPDSQGDQCGIPYRGHSLCSSYHLYV